MNTPFTHSFHKAVVTSKLFFGFTTLTSMAQTTPNTQPPTTAAKPTAAPVQTTSAPAVATQNPNAPVRIAPAQQPVNGQVGNNPLNTNESVPTNQLQNQTIQQPMNGQVGTNPKNFDRSIPTSQLHNIQNTAPTTQTGNATPAGTGYNTSGGIVNSTALQSDAATEVHYHYHYGSAGQPIGTAPAGYAQATYENPDKLDQSPQAMNNQSASGGENSMYNYANNNDYGGMYTYQNDNYNPNSRVNNGGGAGTAATWNPYMADGSGRLTYNGDGGGGIEGFND